MATPRYRASDHLSFAYEFTYELRLNQIGYVGVGNQHNLSRDEPLDAPLLLAYGGDADDVLLSRRHVTTFSNTATYSFTNQMSCNFRLRHYVSNVHYRDFARLRPDSLETPEPSYARNRDNTFNAFNVDAVYSWWFAPGSQVSIVWENAAHRSWNPTRLPRSTSITSPTPSVPRTITRYR